MLHDEEHDDFEDDAEAWLDNRLKSVDDRSIFSIYFYSLFVSAFYAERKTFGGFKVKNPTKMRTKQIGEERRKILCTSFAREY